MLRFSPTPRGFRICSCRYRGIASTYHLHQHISGGRSRSIAVCQQRRRHDQLENLGIAGFLCKLMVNIDLPVMLDNLCFGTFHDKLCTDILLTGASRSVHARWRSSSHCLANPRFSLPQAATHKALPAYAFPSSCDQKHGFPLRVKQAELLMPAVKDVRPLVTALSELGALKIQNNLPESLNLLILLPALFPEQINGACSMISYC